MTNDLGTDNTFLTPQTEPEVGSIRTNTGHFENQNHRFKNPHIGSDHPKKPAIVVIRKTTGIFRNQNYRFNNSTLIWIQRKQHQGPMEGAMLIRTVTGLFENTNHRFKMTPKNGYLQKPQRSTQKSNTLTEVTQQVLTILNLKFVFTFLSIWSPIIVCYL